MLSTRCTSMIAASPGPFLFTPNSLLLNHALITDAQQVTGKDGNQWINCTSGDQSGPEIISGDQRFLVSSGGGSNTATSELSSFTSNGRYFCHIRISTRAYFSVYLKNSSKQHTRINIGHKFACTFTNEYLCYNPFF